MKEVIGTLFRERGLNYFKEMRFFNGMEFFSKKVDVYVFQRNQCVVVSIWRLFFRILRRIMPCCTDFDTIFTQINDIKYMLHFAFLRDLTITMKQKFSVHN